MKYSVRKVSKHNGIFWAVFAGRKEVAVFATSDEANVYVQRCVEDDAWFAANQ